MTNVEKMAVNSNSEQYSHKHVIQYISNLHYWIKKPVVWWRHNECTESFIQILLANFKEEG